MRALTQIFNDAVVYALDAHAEQARKGTDTPYAAHLLGVASTVLEAGGDETAAIVALLHDVVEDQNLDGKRLEDVRARFGDVVAEAVAECSLEAKTETTEWRPRKLVYIEHMRIATPLALLVSVADKLYNLRTTVDVCREMGHDAFGRFNAPDPEAVLGYYEALAEIYAERRDELPWTLVSELERLVSQLRVLIGRPDCPRCGAGDVVPVIIGLPVDDDFAREAAGEVVLAGCIFDDDTPDWSCRRCGEGWRDWSIDR